MILADTSIWVDFLDHGDAVMAALIESGDILLHPYVLGEIALGNLKPRAPILHDLGKLPRACLAGPDELLAFVERHALFGSGIGYVDAHLLASTMIAPEGLLWTRDKRLLTAAERLGVAARPVH